MGSEAYEKMALALKTFPLEKYAFGTAAVKQAIVKGFQEPHIRRIEAFVDPKNIACSNVSPAEAHPGKSGKLTP